MTEDLFAHCSIFFSEILLDVNSKGFFFPTTGLQ